MGRLLFHHGGREWWAWVASGTDGTIVFEWGFHHGGAVCSAVGLAASKVETDQDGS